MANGRCRFRSRPDARAPTTRQHYLDARGVIRVYEMTVSDDVWELARTSRDSQRFGGTFSADGNQIVGG